MASIRQWAFSVCVAMVICGIARILIPKGSMQKVLGITISAFLLCTILSPILLQNPSFSLDIRAQSNEDIAERARRLTETVDRQEEEAVSAGVRKIVGEKLTEMGINYLHITIHISQNGQSEMVIGQVEVLLDRKYAEGAAGIRDVLQEELEIPVTLAFAGEGGEEDEASGMDEESA
jgi:hypothetical protein